MRTLEARWDIDVPRSGTDEGDEIGEKRVHLGLRLSRGRHEDPYMTTDRVSVPAELGQISSETTTDT